jgi:hypothetical protein
MVRDCMTLISPVLTSRSGLLDRSGKRLPLTLVALAIRRHYDLSPTFAFQLTSSAAFIAQQSGGRDWMDLSDLSAPNIIEHDASLTREPVAQVPPLLHR